MLLSMTGFGESQIQEGDTTVALEVRSINNRYLKINIRGADLYSSLESQIESEIRKQLKRGTITINLKVTKNKSEDDYRINETVITNYLKQLKSIESTHLADESVLLTSLLQLPGVIQEQASEDTDPQADWSLIKRCLNDSLVQLNSMRLEEGNATAQDLKTNCQTIAEQLKLVEQRAPQVVENYRTRISERLNKILEEYEVETDTAVIVREVGIFAEHADISEEIVRLNSHLDQFHQFMKLKEPSGRKIEFLVQEMGRETNTIGSKANDSEIALHVVEMKAALERIREQIQNIE